MNYTLIYSERPIVGDVAGIDKNGNIYIVYYIDSLKKKSKKLCEDIKSAMSIYSAIIETMASGTHSDNYRHDIILKNYIP